MRYSIPVAYALWLVSGCGALGLHRFYLGKTGTGILWFFSGGLAMFGSFYDFFTLPRQVEEANLKAEMREALGYRRREALSSRAGFPGAKESVERVILRAAKKNGGYVTPGEVALEGDIALEEARKALEKLAASGHAEMRVRSSGVVVYVFPEFASGGERDFEV